MGSMQILCGFCKMSGNSACFVCYWEGSNRKRNIVDQEREEIITGNACAQIRRDLIKYTVEGLALDRNPTRSC